MQRKNQRCSIISRHLDDATVRVVRIVINVWIPFHPVHATKWMYTLFLQSTRLICCKNPPFRYEVALPKSREIVGKSCSTNVSNSTVE